MKKVTYIIEQELHQNGDWYRVASEQNLPKAKQKYKLFLKNTKGNHVMAEMKAKQRMKKVTEEILFENNSF